MDLLYGHQMIIAASNLRVQGEFVQVVALVKGKVFSQVEKFLQGLVDENDADEWGEGFLCETRDVTNERTGIRGHQQDAEEGCPQTNAGPQREVGQAVLPVMDEEAKNIFQ